jgi:hypothetical protein
MAHLAKATRLIPADGLALVSKVRSIAAIIAFCPLDICRRLPLADQMIERKYLAIRRMKVGTNFLTNHLGCRRAWTRWLGVIRDR